VIQEDEIAFVDIAPGTASDTVYETLQAPPTVSARGQGNFYPLGLDPGLARWLISEFAPDAVAPMHHTDTLGFHVVLAGSVDLILDTGVHLLQAGDCVVLTGVDHAWRVGPDGCRFSVVLLGSNSAS
jgi:hypothetical protein